MTESKSLGPIFGDPKENERNERSEYWYWSDDATLGEMRVTRDGRGRFVEFHWYTPLIIRGKETDAEKRKRVDGLGEIRP